MNNLQGGGSSLEGLWPPMLKLLLSYIVFNRNIYTLMTIVKNVKMNIQAYITQLANGADLYFSDIYIAIFSSVCLTVKKYF